MIWEKKLCYNENNLTNKPNKKSVIYKIRMSKKTKN